MLRSEVLEFLNLLKGCLMLDLFHVRDRQKNIQSLIDLGMNVTERKQVLLSLEPEDYVKGPEPDETDVDKVIWVFGKRYNGKEIYIKIRVDQDSKIKGRYRAVVWSFHAAENKLDYPLAE